jgi:transketolase
MSVAFPHMNVKVVGSHAGISIGEDGPSQMGIEDVALACELPGFAVVVPADEPSTRAATRAIAAHQGPCYLRTGRPKVPIVYENGCDNFKLGKAIQLREGHDVTLIANGIMVAKALEAAEALAKEGKQARVLDMHTVKPLDHEAVEKAARETMGIVVCEEHLLAGGLGSRVAMSASMNYPTHMRFIGLDDTYAESGKPDELLEKYGLTSQHIVDCAREIAHMEHDIR